ncbi:hypothetical protein FEP87_04856 [Burkholderia multivorans]|nr:hypothetical protein [Burkholderia multivorans]
MAFSAPIQISAASIVANDACRVSHANVGQTVTSISSAAVVITRIRPVRSDRCPTSGVTSVSTKPVASVAANPVDAGSPSCLIAYVGMYSTM